MDEQQLLPRERFAQLLDALEQAGYQTIAPQVKDGAILYRHLQDVSQLPQGVEEHQAAGEYRLRQTDSPRYFSWANGPYCLKPLTFAPEEPLWRMRHEAGELAFETIAPEVKASAVLGVRACDLAALWLQESHFLHGDQVDVHFEARDKPLFLIAVDCSHPSDCCFCASTGDGPRAVAGYDLAMAELDEGFLLRSGSETGHRLLESLELVPAGDEQLSRARQADEQALKVQRRSLPSRNLAAALAARREHPHWQQVAERCLSCGNCTAVCPTCFCHQELDEPALDGGGSVHLRQWDSCFSDGHSALHKIPVRGETAHRYRQWLSHKLGYWHEQYDRSGCVGCGRCITWCPVGIDLTAEVAALLVESA